MMRISKFEIAVTENPSISFQIRQSHIKKPYLSSDCLNSSFLSSGTPLGHCRQSISERVDFMALDFSKASSTAFWILRFENRDSLASQAIYVSCMKVS